MTRFLLVLFLLSGVPALQAQSTNGAQRGADARNGATEAEVFIQAFQAIRSYSLNSLGDSILWEKAIEGLVEGLGDPYAAVFTPSEVEAFEEETTGNYAGIGVQISDLNQEITITAVFRGTPAEAAGIQVGDVIVGVDDDSAEEWTTADTSRRIRGEVGTMVDVIIRREGMTEPMRYPIRRDQVHVSSVISGRIFGDIGYIALDRVAENSAAEVDSALVELEDTRGIILDLRQNPGGLLDESLYLADLFLEEGERLAAVKGRVPGRPAPVEEAWTAQAPARVGDVPIVILVDRFTASAAEILAGALQDHDRALVMGERTFGKGVVQTVLALPAGRRIRLTTGEWFTPLGRGLHRARDRDGTPLPEQLDTIRTVRSPQGRELMAGGGIFPDLGMQEDTLRLVEREFLGEASAAQYPLGVRLQEIAFDQVRAMSAGGTGAITEQVVEGFLTELSEAGISEGLTQDPVVVDYLRWRLTLAFHQRAGNDGRAAEVRAERDPVLTQAVELLAASSSQTDLFLRADQVQTARETREGALPGSGGH